MATTHVPAPAAPSSAPVGPPLLRLPAALRGTSSRSVVLSWVLSRSLTLMTLVYLESSVIGDVSYYGTSLNGFFHGAGTIRTTLQEYPLPVLGIMLPQFLIGGMNKIAFALLFVVSMLAVDAAFTTVLWKVAGRQRGGAVRLWLWFVPLVGPLAYFRFDLVPAALAGAAVLAAARRPGLTGFLTAVGAALKLWPAVMLPIFLIRSVDRRRVTTAFVATGAVIVLASVVIGGVGRLFSPLHWQSARGLQIESVPATPLMIARAIHPHGVWHLKISKYIAWEIFGAGVHPVVVLSTGLTAAGLALLGWLWWRAHRQPDTSAETLGWLLVATTIVLTVANKALSPQYILWLGGPVCALLARYPRELEIQRFSRRVLLLAAVTQLLYPLAYSGLTGTSWATPLATTVLTVRNVLLCYLGWVACRQVWLRTRRDVTEDLATEDALAR